jgi:hypothetical protein
MIGAMVLASAAGRALAQEDPGRTKVGALQVTVYFATDGDPGAAGESAREVPEEVLAKLRVEDKLGFAHYRMMGSDTCKIFRSYENWAQPLKPSDEILIRFETRSQPKEDSVLLDLELWLSRKKILKTDAPMSSGSPLYVLGPEWRGGRLIIAAELAK